MFSASETPFLSPHAVAALKTLGRRFSGMTLTGLAVLGASALLSFHSADPSLNTASAGGAQNVVGHPGALLADLLIQSMGIGTIFPILMLAWWGRRFIKGEKLDRPGRRFLSLVMGVLLISWGLHPFPFPEGWPVLTGWGGTLGFLAGNLTRNLLFEMGLPVGFLWILPCLLIPPGLLAAGFSMMLSSSEIARLKTFSGALIRPLKTAFAKGGEWLKSKLPAPRSRPVAPPRQEPTLVAKTPATEKSAKRDIRQREDQAAAKKTPKQASLALPREGRQYTAPPLALLGKAKKNEKSGLTKAQLDANAKQLEAVLNEFGVEGEIVRVRPGPVITLYELQPAPGIKTSRVIGLADDIARAMGAVSVRTAVIPGETVIGIELPNESRETVFLREMFTESFFSQEEGRLRMGLGKTIGGKPSFVDLADMPHLLVAGTTGSGKSVAINTMILSLLYRLSPQECRLILIDPKMLELSVYNDIPHLLTPVVTEPEKAVKALKWAVREMEDRYKAMSQMNVRNIEGYNEKIARAAREGQKLTRKVQTGFDPETGAPHFEEQELGATPLPYIVVVVDEMADLMLVASKEVEAAIQRLAQMARAAGIHLIMATQRPSVDVITGTIKANFPSRVGFAVTSRVDSRTILGEQGAEQLLGRGDMLYMSAGQRITRLHGPFVSDEEVEKVVTHLKAQGSPVYENSITTEETGNTLTGLSDGEEAEFDPLYNEAVSIIIRDQKASTSYIQRQLKIGYNRAARLVEQMEEQGVVSEAGRNGKREILVGEDG